MDLKGVPHPSQSRRSRPEVNAMSSKAQWHVLSLVALRSMRQHFLLNRPCVKDKLTCRDLLLTSLITWTWTYRTVTVTYHHGHSHHFCPSFGLGNLTTNYGFWYFNCLSFVPRYIHLYFGLLARTGSDFSWRRPLDPDKPWSKHELICAICRTT